MNMSLSALVVNIIIGVVFVLIWGILTYIISSETEFKSFFFGGLANFVFFLGGIVASYLAQFAGPESPTVDQPLTAASPGQSAFSIMVAMYVAIVTMLTVVLLNLFQEGFTKSLSKLEQLGTVAFTPEGYRDIQIFAGGSFSILCFLGASIYGLYLGAVRPHTTYLTVLAGVAVSLGVQGLLYVLFGIFFSYQALSILSVSAPPVIGTFGPGLQRFFGFGITSATVLFVTVSWTTLLWSSIKLGEFISKI